jgi:hypothetical protein
MKLAQSLRKYPSLLGVKDGRTNEKMDPHSPLLFSLDRLSFGRAGKQRECGGMSKD